MIERLLRRTGLVMLGTGFSKGLLLVLELFIARALGAAGYGAFSLGLATLFVVANAALLGLNFGVIQYLSVHQEEQRPDDPVGELLAHLDRLERRIDGRGLARCQVVQLGDRAAEDDSGCLERFLGRVGDRAAQPAVLEL